MGAAVSASDSRKRFKDAKGAMSHIHDQMREDFEFADPSNPKQWDENVRTAYERNGIPCLTFDQTNQYKLQVTNDARQNKPSIKVRGVDSQADPKVADALQGIIYHIEDASRASIAYDTAIDHAATGGLGWMRIVPEVTRPERNEQEIRIKRIADPFACVLEDWSEPDGSDSMAGYVETRLSKTQFKRLYPKENVDLYDREWSTDDTLTLCEEFVIDEDEETRYIVLVSGERLDLSEDDYADLVQRTGQTIPYANKYKAKVRTQTWRKFSGGDILEETEFPASFIPLVPVIGNESWIDGKRWLCGMVRRMRDPAMAYNYERSKYVQTVGLQSVAPWIGPAEAFEGYEDQWGGANADQNAYLPYNHKDGSDNPLPPPVRQTPPTVSTAFVQGATMARDDLQASIGMYRSNLGAPSNAVSGRAKMQDQREGDTATFHYIDNLRISISHLGRIVVQMIPKIYDTKRVQRILGEDGEASQVIIDPNQDQASRTLQQPGGKPQLSINPNVGEYDVTVSTGPAYSTRRQETFDNLQELAKNPQVAPLIMDMIAKMGDWPEADKIAARFKAMLPPQVLAAENADDPQAQMQAQQIQQMHQQLQQLQQALQAAQAQLKQKADDAAQANANDHDKNKIAAYQAETARLAALVPADPQLAAALYQQTLMAVMQLPTPMGGIPSALPAGVPPPQIPPPPPAEPEPATAGPPQQPRGPSGPFSMGGAQ